MSTLKLVWVAALSGCYGYQGKYYGPSTEPLEVPENLAQSLGLEILQTPPEGQASAPTTDAELQAAYDALKAEHETLKATHQQAVDAGLALQTKVTELTTAVSDAQGEQSRLQSEANAAIEALNTAVNNANATRDAALAKVEELIANANKPSLPTLEELIAIKGVGETLARTILEVIQKKAA